MIPHSSKPGAIELFLVARESSAGELFVAVCPTCSGPHHTVHSHADRTSSSAETPRRGEWIHPSHLFTSFRADRVADWSGL